MCKQRCETLEAVLSSSVLPTLWTSWILFLVSKAQAQVLLKEGQSPGVAGPKGEKIKDKLLV